MGLGFVLKEQPICSFVEAERKQAEWDLFMKKDDGREAACFAT